MDKANPSQAPTPRLRNNIASLGMVQVANYAIPLVTLPYLTRVLGPMAYGQVAFAQVLMVYFVLLTDYGFSWSATRKIAAHRDDRAYISRVFIGTWTAQWLLVVVAASLATLAVLYVDRLRPDASLYALAFTAVVGNALFPIWFLQGLERLQAVAAIQVTSRLVALLPIFVLVKAPSDAGFVLAINGGAAVLSGLLSIGWIRYQHLADWHWPGWPAVMHELHDGRALFGSRVVISFYTTLVPLALGWIAGPVALANFSLADKLRTAAQALLSPLSQALFPRMTHLFATDKSAAFHLLKRSLLAVLVIAGSASALLWIFAEPLAVLLGGEAFRPASAALRWLALLPLLIGLSNVFGVQVMLPNSMNRPFNIILTAAGGLSILLIWPLIQQMQAVGAAQTMLIVELFVTGSMALLLYKRGYLSFQRDES